jgi:hypothetical protein
LADPLPDRPATALVLPAHEPAFGEDPSGQLDDIIVDSCGLCEACGRTAADLDVELMTRDLGGGAEPGPIR